VLRCKPDQHGMAKVIKARATLRGDLEKATVSKSAAYSPVAHAVTIRLLIALHLSDGSVEFHQYDIASAYLTAPQKREVYVRIPPYMDKRYAGNAKVARLYRALYGGKDSGRCYYDYFRNFHIKELGFKTVHHDQCLLILNRPDGQFIHIAYHVDDVVVASRGEDIWAWYQSRLSERFEYTLGPLSYFLGLNFEFGIHPTTGTRTCRIQQTPQIDKALRDLGMADSKGAKTPTANNEQPSLADLPSDPLALEQGMKKFPMMEAIAHMGWIYQHTRPDIGYPLKILSKFGQRHGTRMHDYCRHVLRYLKQTRDLGLEFVGGEQPVIQVCTDANHASDPDTRRSISSVIIKLGGNTVYWRSRYQKIVSHSSTESELMAVDEGVRYAQFVRYIVEAILGATEMPIPIFVDNQSTLQIAHNPVQPGRNVHVHARYFYVRDLADEGIVELQYLSTDEQPADIQCVHKNAKTFLYLRSIVLHHAILVRKQLTPDKHEWSWMALPPLATAGN
jgi:hypothetical protein